MSLFSAMPLYLLRTVEQRALIGTVFVLGAVLIVSCQLPGYVAVFAGKQVTVAIGESVGAFLGGTGFLFVSAALDSDAAYWFLAAGVGLAAVLAVAARPGAVGQKRSVG